MPAERLAVPPALADPEEADAVAVVAEGEEDLGAEAIRGRAQVLITASSPASVIAGGRSPRIPVRFLSTSRTQPSTPRRFH